MDQMEVGKQMVIKVFEDQIRIFNLNNSNVKNDFQLLELIESIKDKFIGVPDKVVEEFGVDRETYVSIICLVTLDMIEKHILFG
jgi:hypothetical protein